ncbi:hypothetical protein ACQEVZ_60260 [Dactylosporangium sp. CA-152071]|uniref:hypothetical protein n=1 Tax=Dactylosporangium sp. CA-152071 TaxID=3239933 RepID=UPI003D94046C
MSFINEISTNVGAPADVVEDPLEPLLEVTSVLRTSHQGAEVEGVELLAQRSRVPG